MIETVVNLNGVEEKFDAKRLNNWVKGSLSEKIKDRWNEIAIDLANKMPKKVTVTQLLSGLVDRLLAGGTWTHYVVAGRVYAMLMRMEIFGSKNLPTVKTVQEKLHKAGLMRKLNYTDYEWAVIEKTIDHDLDFDMPHYALEQIRKKYSLQDFGSKTEYETPQFVYMRMAMSIFESMSPTDPDHPLINDDPTKRSRLEHVIRIYNHFAHKRLSAPTPNYNNMGTHHRGYASCCVVAAGDCRFSIATADHITYLMTTQSAGQGLNQMVRSLGDPVQNGRFLHRGKKPYIDAFGKNINANLQGGRGGAGTYYASLFDPESKLIFGLRDTRATDEKRNRDAHYSYVTNRYMLQLALRGKQMFTWNVHTAPKLHELFYSGDVKAFAEEYERLEKDDSFEKNYVDAREVYLHALSQGVQTGTIYATSIDEMNANTPFVSPIRSSNLCVAPETLILTKDGYVEISRKVGQHIFVWNGKEWSGVKIVRTGRDQKLLKVVTSSGFDLHCTEYHKWYIKDDESKAIIEKRTIDLKPGDVLIDFDLPTDEFEFDEENTKASVENTIVEIIDEGRIDDTYCATEYRRGMIVFNGILTGNCKEVSEPTEPYMGRDAMKHLYTDGPVGKFKAVCINVDGTKYDWKSKPTDSVKVIHNEQLIRKDVQDLKPGDRFTYDEEVFYQLVEIKECVREPEIALCSLGAINVTDELTDEQYRDAMYYGYKMIDYAILENDYIFPHLKYTATSRMNAGMGIMGVATHMARRKLKYNSKEGLKELHRVFERHMYYAIEASLTISKERGNAPWIHRTKWVDGWNTLSNYRKEIDKISDFEYHYDHEEQKQRVIANGGIAHSTLVNYMPGESSSKALGAVNSYYGIRQPVMIKVDANNVLRWAAPYSDDPEYEYHSMWDTSLIDQNSVHGIAQKWCDQAASADWWLNFSNNLTIGSKELLEAERDRIMKGIKTRYYINTLMPADQKSLEIKQSAVNQDKNKADTELMNELAAAGISFQNEGGDGHAVCEGCST